MQILKTYYNKALHQICVNSIRSNVDKLHIVVQNFIENGINKILQVKNLKYYDLSMPKEFVSRNNKSLSISI